LQEVHDRQGNFKSLPNALSTWISKQRRKAREGTLDQEKRSELEKIGIELSGYQTNKNGIQEIRDVCLWNAQFEKVKRFRQMNGHCNVPKRYKEDKSLAAAWVSAQRRRYMKLKEMDVSQSYTAEWVERLEEIGFAWTCKQKRSQLR
jgi:DNA mismatch repair ATPase MutL